MGGKRRSDENGVPVGDHRCTPPEVFEAALRAIGRTEFDLDVATNPHALVPAKVKWMGPSAEDPRHRVDALTADWSLPRHERISSPDVWVNHPWSDSWPWVRKVCVERDRVRSITMLGLADMSTGWNQELTRACEAWCVWHRRPHFPLPHHPKGSPTVGVQVWYFGPSVRRWRLQMESEGCLTFPGRIRMGDL